MKDKKPIITPDMFPHVDVDPEVINSISPEKREYFKKSKAYRDTVVATIKQDNRRKRSVKIVWFKEHFIDLLALIIAAASLVVSIIALLQ